MDYHDVHDETMSASELTYFRDLVKWYMKEGFDFEEACTRAREEWDGEIGG